MLLCATQTDDNNKAVSQNCMEGEIVFPNTILLVYSERYDEARYREEARF